MSTGSESAPEALTDRIEAALAGPLSETGLDVEAVEVVQAGPRRVLRVAVDQDGGVTLDDVAQAARAVGDVLDASDVMGAQPYTLEVTSRGVDRPLTAPRHWRRNATRLVKVTLVDGSSMTGRVVASDDDPDGAVTLEVSGRERRLPYAQVRRALVQIEFNPPKAAARPEADDVDDVDDADDENEGSDDESTDGTDEEEDD